MTGSPSTLVDSTTTRPALAGAAGSALGRAQQHWLSVFPTEWSTPPLHHPEHRGPIPIPTLLMLERRGLVERRWTSPLFVPSHPLRYRPYEWRRTAAPNTQAEPRR